MGKKRGYAAEANVDIKTLWLCQKENSNHRYTLMCPSETRLRRGTSIFTLKVAHFGNHKARVPVANERIWALNAFLPFIHGTGDFIQGDTPLQQFKGLAGQAYERRRFLLKQGAEI